MSPRPSWKDIAWERLSYDLLDDMTRGEPGDAWLLRIATTWWTLAPVDRWEVRRNVRSTLAVLGAKDPAAVLLELATIFEQLAQVARFVGRGDLAPADVRDAYACDHAAVYRQWAAAVHLRHEIHDEVCPSCGHTVRAKGRADS